MVSMAFETFDSFGAQQKKNSSSLQQASILPIFIQSTCLNSGGQHRHYKIRSNKPDRTITKAK